MKLTSFYLILCFSIGILYPKSTVSTKEKNALLDLYHTTEGEKWNNPWDLNTPIETWKGITVEDNHIVGINLFRNNLSGTLPTSLGRLRYLRHLNLAFNNITGVLPKEIVKLENLTVLRLEMNRIKGELPDDIAQ
ncbi:MAG: hypothetical protein AAF575_12070, partial [Bacteroidota bacterium]